MASLPPTPSAQWWVWGDTGQVSKEGIPGLQQRHPGALTDAAGRDVPKGTRLKNHTHHPLKKNITKHQKSTTNNYKTPPPTFSFMRARNATKLRGRQATAALLSCPDQAIAVQPHSCQPSWLGAGDTPRVHPTQQRAASSSPRDT